MKVKILSIALIGTMSCISAGAQAAIGQNAPAQALLQWQGWVGGAFNSADIALTGSGGGNIGRGVLNLNTNGSFNSARNIVVEAHATIDDGNGSYSADTAFYDGDVDWSVSTASIDSDVFGYSNSDLRFEINGENVEVGNSDVVTTTVGNNTVSVATSYISPIVVNGKGVTLPPGTHVAVNANLYAQPSVGNLAP